MATASACSEPSVSLRRTASCASPFLKRSSASAGPVLATIESRTGDPPATNLRAKAEIRSASSKPAGPTATVRTVGCESRYQAATARAIAAHAQHTTTTQRSALLN